LFLNRKNFLFGVFKESDGPARANACSEGDWRLADERQRLLAPLAESENGSVEDVDRVARLLKLSRASVYRLLRLFRQHLVATSLLPGSPGRKAGRFILSEPQEKILQQTIEEFYLTPQRPSIAALHRAVCMNCQLAKTDVPSYKTVRSRVMGIDLRRRTRLREGQKAAADKFRPVTGGLKATEPLSGPDRPYPGGCHHCGRTPAAADGASVADAGCRRRTARWLVFISL
jgi:hypothetical protein